MEIGIGERRTTFNFLFSVYLILYYFVMKKERDILYRYLVAFLFFFSFKLIP